MKPKQEKLRANVLADRSHRAQAMSAVTIPIGMSLAEVEKHIILHTLDAFKTQKATHLVLGISAKTLRDRLAAYGDCDSESAP